MTAVVILRPYCSIKYLSRRKGGPIGAILKVQKFICIWPAHDILISLAHSGMLGRQEIDALLTCYCSPSACLHLQVIVGVNEIEQL
jgi:hypothetical protein